MLPQISLREIRGSTVEARRRVIVRKSLNVIPAFHPVARNGTGDLDNPDTFTVGLGQATSR